MPDPDSVADNYHLVVAELLLVGPKCPAQGGLYAEQIEKVGGNFRAPKLFGISGSGEIVAPGLKGADVLEDLILRAPVEKVSGRRSTAENLPVAVRLPDNHDLLRIGERQGPQQDCVYDAEYRRVRADAQRQCDDGNDREARVLAQRARAIL